MDYHIEVITLAVRDVDLAVEFYTKRAGFILDVDYRPNSQFRVVQLTPPGSSCSVQFGVGLTDATPGSARTTYLVVTDIEAAHRELTERGLACQPHSAQDLHGRLARGLLARSRSRAAKLCQLDRLRRPRRQYLDRPRARIHPRGLDQWSEELNRWHLKPQRSSRSTLAACASSITTAALPRARSGSRRLADGSRLAASNSRATAKRISRHMAVAREFDAASRDPSA